VILQAQVLECHESWELTNHGKGGSREAASVLVLTQNGGEMDASLQFLVSLLNLLLVLESREDRLKLRR
jgi:hypothetical protein